MTKMLIVTLPETTPVLEATALQDDLRRAGIEPWAWIVNASLAAALPEDPLLVARARSEYKQLELVKGKLAQRVAVVPWMAEEPVGREALRK
jgi:arsenite-transporting ATPase